VPAASSRDARKCPRIHKRSGSGRLESWRRVPCRVDVLPKALTNPTWRLCWGSAASSVLVRNVYLVHKVLPPPETENRVVGVMGASKSAGVTSRDDFAPVASRERGSVSLPFVQSAATTLPWAPNGQPRSSRCGMQLSTSHRRCRCDQATLLPGQRVKRTDRRSHVW